MAKWNGTKVSVKILDKDSHSDPECMYVLISSSQISVFSLKLPQPFDASIFPV